MIELSMYEFVSFNFVWNLANKSIETIESIESIE